MMAGMEVPMGLGPRAPPGAPFSQSVALKGEAGGISEPSKWSNCGVSLLPQTVISAAFSATPCLWASHRLIGEVAVAKDRAWERC